jgi:hypothetical protein
MPSTPACPLCGLRFENQPLLELHTREDHERVFRARSGDRDPGSARPPAPGADRTPDPHDPAPAPSSTSEKATPGQPGAVERARTALRRALRALR